MKPNQLVETSCLNPVQGRPVDQLIGPVRRELLRQVFDRILRKLAGQPLQLGPLDTAPIADRQRRGDLCRLSRLDRFQDVDLQGFLTAVIARRGVQDPAAGQTIGRRLAQEDEGLPR